MEIIFLTGNSGKLEEARSILGKKIKIIPEPFDLDEIQEIDGKAIIIKKAQEAFKLIKKPLIIEDTSLYFIAWKGLPGALIKWFLKSVGSQGILNMLNGFNNRSAIAQSLIAFHDGKNVRIFEGTVRGKVPHKIKGENGFGWDNIFIAEGQIKTYTEMKSDEKNKKSPRRIALEKLKEYLSANT